MALRGPPEAPGPGSTNLKTHTFRRARLSGRVNEVAPWTGDHVGRLGFAGLCLEAAWCLSVVALLPLNVVALRFKGKLGGDFLESSSLFQHGRLYVLEFQRPSYTANLL